MKGQVKIQLLDKNGNIKKEVCGHNEMTSVISQLFNPPFPDFFECYTPTAYKSNPLNYYTPIVGNSIGGIMLFNQDRPLHSIPNSDDFSKYIGSAGGSFTGTSNRIKGTLNANESQKLDNGYKFVWDFRTGSSFSLKSISLTSRDGGNSGLNFDLDNDTTSPEAYKGYGIYYLNSGNDDKIAHGMTYGNLTNINHIKISDAGDICYVSNDFKTMVLGTLNGNTYTFTKYTFKDSIGINDNLRGNNNTSVTFIDTFNNWKMDYIYTISPESASLDTINKLQWDNNYVYSCKTTYSGSNLTINYVKIDINTFSVAEEKVFTIDCGIALGNVNKYYTINGNRVCILDGNNFLLHVINLDSETLEKSIPFIRRRSSYNLYPSKINNDIVMLVESCTNPNYAVLIDVNNGLTFYTKLGGSTSSNVTAPFMSNLMQLGDSPIFVNKSYTSTSYSYLNVNLFTLYFASVYNLPEIITKSSSDTLKITYTITN